MNDYFCSIGHLVAIELDEQLIDRETAKFAGDREYAGEQATILLNALWDLRGEDNQ